MAKFARLWIDDVREAPEGWLHAHSTFEAIDILKNNDVKYISLDHDAGDFEPDGGDFINVLDWIEQAGGGEKYIFTIHSMNPVGRSNMIRVIEHNHWKLLH